MPVAIPYIMSPALVFGVLYRRHYNPMTIILRFNDIFKLTLSNLAEKQKGHGFETDLQFEAVAGV